jgi:hypothetical protein
MDDFEEIFEDLEDPRTGNAKRHELHEILVIGFCTLLSGGETCADMALFGRSKREFLQEFLRLEQGIPSHDTFSRVQPPTHPRLAEESFAPDRRRATERACNRSRAKIGFLTDDRVYGYAKR